MPMNEFGEIVRDDESSNASTTTTVFDSDNDYHYQETPADIFSSNISDRFAEGRKRNFNLITLAIGIPCYTLIGYIVSAYFGIEISTGLLVGAIASLVIILIYNNSMASRYEGFEYFISILSPCIVAAIIGIVVAILYVIFQIIVQVILPIIVVIFVLGALAGG